MLLNCPGGPRPRLRLRAGAAHGDPGRLFILMAAARPSGALCRRRRRRRRLPRGGAGAGGGGVGPGEVGEVEAEQVAEEGPCRGDRGKGYESESESETVSMDICTVYMYSETVIMEICTVYMYSDFC